MPHQSSSSTLCTSIAVPPRRLGRHPAALVVSPSSEPIPPAHIVLGSFGDIDQATVVGRGEEREKLQEGGQRRKKKKKKKKKKISGPCVMP